jgi:hypothetical protein
VVTRKRGLAAVPDSKRPAPPDLRDALAEALAAMQWNTTADNAMIALAKRYAQQIEEAVERAEELEQLWREAHRMGDERDLFRKRLERLEAKCEVDRMVGWLGPQLQGVIRELGGSSMARKSFGKGSEGGSRLDGLRKRTPGVRPGAAGTGEDST